MRKLFSSVVFLLFCIYISGCNNDLSEKRTTIDSTTIEDRTKIISEYTDSFINSEQDKIIGDLKFGMGRKEVEEKLEAFNKKNKIDKKESAASKSWDEYKIDDFIYIDVFCDYDGSNVSENGHYDSDVIYGVTIMSRIYNSDEYDKVHDQVEYLMKLLSAKYKKAYLEWGISTESQLERVNGNKVIEWQIGKKNIYLSIERINTISGNSFHYMIDIRIYLPAVEEKIKRKKESVDSAKNVF